MNDKVHLTETQAQRVDRLHRLNHSVVLIERNPHVREFQTKFLTGAGFSVEYATDGAAGLELIHRSGPQLVVTEILVPKLDGLALCRRLKSNEETSQIAVLICSILAAKGRAHDAGADAFLRKPLAEQRFIELARQLFAQRPPST